mmetsp:Transcript_19456/g.54673  ORF Transcript_19456/g.54673 Transcript_19456/m.54673 type:complete len:255 (+) Transcript_19456:1570-2334(+)
MCGLLRGRPEGPVHRSRPGGPSQEVSTDLPEGGEAPHRPPVRRSGASGLEGSEVSDYPGVPQGLDGPLQTSSGLPAPLPGGAAEEPAAVAADHLPPGREGPRGGRGERSQRPRRFEAARGDIHPQGPRAHLRGGGLRPGPCGLCSAALPGDVPLPRDWVAGAPGGPVRYRPRGSARSSVGRGEAGEPCSGFPAPPADVVGDCARIAQGDSAEPLAGPAAEFALAVPRDCGLPSCRAARGRAQPLQRKHEAGGAA